MSLRIIATGVLVMAFGLLPGLSGAAVEPEADRVLSPEQYESMNNLEALIRAMDKYHDTDPARGFPPAYSTHDDKPLLSWRVLLLPFLEDYQAQALYEEFRLDEPWDSEHNKPLVAKMPAIYQSPASKWKDGRTVYLVPCGQGTMFPGKESTSARKITDGLARTIAILEVGDDQAVEWTKPADWKFDPAKPTSGLKGLYAGKFLAVTVSGGAHAVPITIDPKRLKACLTISGQEDETIDGVPFPRIPPGRSQFVAPVRPVRPAP